MPGLSVPGRLLGAAAALMFAGAAGAAGTDVAVVPKAGPSPETALVRRLLEMELARKIADSDIAVAGVQLGSGAAPELLIVPLTDASCPETGCRPRLLKVVAGGYADLFDGLAFPGRVDPDRFLVRPARHGEYYDLVVDGRALIHNGKTYVEAATIEPTRLDGSSVGAACLGSRLIIAQTETRNRDPAADAPALCECIVSGFEERRATQQNLDLYARYLSGAATDAELYGPDAPFHAISDIGDEAMEGCFGTLGWNDPITPAVDDYPDGYRNLNFDGLVDACTAQPWVTDNRHLRNPSHAVTYCGCLASGLLKLGFGQSALDELASFYREEISEADMQPAFPTLLDKHDEISEKCIGGIRWARD